jgi:hypothetical protein
VASRHHDADLPFELAQIAIHLHLRTGASCGYDG